MALGLCTRGVAGHDGDRAAGRLPRFVAQPTIHVFYSFHAGHSARGHSMSGPTLAVVWLHPAAPPKPAEGAPCNGCGLCCLAEPCPLGVLVSGRRSGACTALRWSDDTQRYLCGMVADPASVTGWRSRWALRMAAALARRWIAAGAGCDAHLQAHSAGPSQP